MHHPLLLLIRKLCSGPHISPLPSSSSSSANESLICQTITFLRQAPCTPAANLGPLHARLIVAGLSDDPDFSGHFVRLCALSPSDGSISHALHYLTRLSRPTIFSFNTIIKGFLSRSLPALAIDFFKHQMVRRGVLPNEYTLPLLINASAQRNQVYEGEIFHCIAYKLLFYLVLPVTNSLIHMYWNCGLLDSARQIFDQMPVRDLVSWNSMIDGCAKIGDLTVAEGLFWDMPSRNVISWNTLISGFMQNQRFKKGLWFFSRMVNEFGERPDEATTISVLSACARLQSVALGKTIHGYLVRNFSENSVALDTALVNFYCKCNLLTSAYVVFEKMPRRDLICWNAMIAGNAELGKGGNAVVLFSQMLKEKVKPDDITFVGLLTGCAHAGLVEESEVFFKSMSSDFGVKPKFAHYWCLIDLYTRSGNQEKAFEVVKNMPMEAPSSIWGAIFAVARIYGETEVGEYVGRRLIELEPHNNNRYAPLMNLYAAAGNWDSYNSLIKTMKAMGLKRQPDRSGCATKLCISDWAWFTFHRPGLSLGLCAQYQMRCSV
ncbi:Pentatricopeptide repeat-containing protein [Nymphaea thermarum]|nr:Pentatricopeptide repeat-containing protein [Nymphaea thermarum]